MRLLMVIALFAFASPTFGADKNEDEVKEVTLAFLKALKAKDLDGILKTIDAPFLFEDAKEPVTKPDDLKAHWEKFLPKVRPEKIPTAVGMVMGVPAFAKTAATDKEKRYADYVEKLVGKTGYVVFITTPNGRTAHLFVHMKDGKAKVAGFGD